MKCPKCGIPMREINMMEWQCINPLCPDLPDYSNVGNSDEAFRDFMLMTIQNQKDEISRLQGILREIEEIVSKGSRHTCLHHPALACVACSVAAIARKWREK